MIGSLIKSYFASLSKEERVELFQSCINGLSEEDIIEFLGGERRIAQILIKGVAAMDPVLRKELVRHLLGEEWYGELERILNDRSMFVLEDWKD